MCSFWYFGSYDITDCKLHFRIRFFGAFADEMIQLTGAVQFLVGCLQRWLELNVGRWIGPGKAGLGTANMLRV